MASQSETERREVLSPFSRKPIDPAVLRLLLDNEGANPAFVASAIEPLRVSTEGFNPGDWRKFWTIIIAGCSSIAAVGFLCLAFVR